jgi:hypothetical protein
MTVGQYQRRHCRALDTSLKVEARVRDLMTDRNHNVPSAGTAPPLLEPAGRICRQLERRLRMRDTATAANVRERKRILHPCNCLGLVSEQNPALGNPGQELGPILEAGTAHGASGLVCGGENLERREELLSINGKGRAGHETNVCLCSRNSILIAKKISDQRRISAAARGCGKGAARDGCDQHGGFPIH